MPGAASGRIRFPNLSMNEFQTHTFSGFRFIPQKFIQSDRRHRSNRHGESPGKIRCQTIGNFFISIDEIKDHWQISISKKCGGLLSIPRPRASLAS